MAERPILFSPQMVNQILAGNKTQTRRVMHGTPVLNFSETRWHYFKKPSDADSMCHWANEVTEVPPFFTGRQNFITGPTPYGAVGDRLWVRETYTEFNGEVVYRANCVDADGDEKEDVKEARLAYQVKWRPSIFMPRRLSRITLEITNFRAERLHDIMATDVIDEGVWPRHFTCVDQNWHRAWRAKWVEINGQASWDENPWVWVIHFKRVIP